MGYITGEVFPWNQDDVVGEGPLVSDRLDSDWATDNPDKLTITIRLALSHLLIQQMMILKWSMR